MALELSSVAFLVHVFAARDATSIRHLEAVWRACGSRLGLTEVDGPEDLTAELARASGTVAVRHGAAPAGRAELRAQGDLLTLSARFDADAGSRSSWADLEERWSAAVPAATVEILGSVHVLTALVPHGFDAVEPIDALVADTTLPPGRPGPPADLPDHLRVHELVAGDLDDGRAHRRLVVLADAAPPDHDAASALARWTGSGRAGAPGRLVAYLEHAALLRHEYRVWREDDFQSTVRSANDAVDELGSILTRPDDQLSDEQLAGEELQVRDARARRAGLVDLVVRLRRMRRLAAHGHARLLYLVPSASGPFADDTEFADWFADQLAADVANVEWVRERAEDIDSLAAAAVQRRLLAKQEQLRTREEAAARRRERINLMQAGVIGAVLLALTTAQTLDTQLPLDLGFKLAIAAVVASLGLSLSVAAIAVALPGRRATSTLLAVALAVAALTGSLVWCAVEWHNQAAAGDRRWGTLLPSASAFGVALVVAVIAVSVRVRRGRRE